MKSRHTPQYKAVSSLVSEIGTVYRATAIYPSKHPAKNIFIDPLIGEMNSYLAEAGSLELAITPRGIDFDGVGIVTRNHAELFLSGECGERRIRTIRFTGEIQRRDMDAFFSMIYDDAELVLDEGGAAEYLRTRGSGALEVVSDGPAEDVQKTTGELSPERVESLVDELIRGAREDREGIQARLESVEDLSVPILLRRLAVEDEILGRKVLLDSLGSFGQKVRPYLARWLKDEKWYVIRNALALMIRVGGRWDAPGVKGYLSHAHPKVRFEALCFLSRFPISVDDATVDSLLNDTSPEVREKAIYALALLQGRRGYNRLLEMAKKPPIGQGDVSLRTMAIRGIGRSRAVEAVEFLKGLLTVRPVIGREPFDRIQLACVEALMEIGSAVDALQWALDRLTGDSLRAAQDYLRRRDNPAGEDIP